MPIKFRCTHCRQFLGISHTKAGAIVDCPTCGRSVRVPSPDGRIEPLPAPGLNLEDAHLAGALDELARIGSPPEPEDSDEDSAEDSAAWAQTRPAPAAVVVPPAPQPAAVPVDPPGPPIAAPKAPSDQRRLEGGERGRSAPQSASEPPDAASPVAVSPVPNLPLFESQGPARPDSSSSRAAIPRRTLGTFPMGLLLLSVGAAAFGAGYYVGRGAGPAAPPHSETASANGKTDDRSAVPPRTAEAAFRGRITYRTSEGQSRPDQGARVFFFPEERKGTALLPVTGFRSGDEPEDFAVAVAGLRALGGDVAIADDEGAYAASLPAAGRYHVLVLSRAQPRGDEPTPPVLRRLLAEYFERPEQLLGRVRYHFSQVRYSGAGPEPWDYSFEPLY